MKMRGHVLVTYPLINFIQTVLQKTLLRYEAVYRQPKKENLDGQPDFMPLLDGINDKSGFTTTSYHMHIGNQSFQLV